MEDTELERAALQLGPNERIELAQKLLSSVHTSNHSLPGLAQAVNEEDVETISAAVYWHRLRARLD